MAITNYRKGSDKERRIVNKARKEGKIAFRSAGSHSPIDVCIIDLKGHQIEFIQSKPKGSLILKDGSDSSLAARIKEEMKELNGGFMVYFDVL